MSDSHAPATKESHEPAAHGADAHGDENFWGHCKLYFWIGGILCAFTAITVFLAYVNFADFGPIRRLFGVFGVHGNQINIVIGMIVATFKVSLVAAIFMHLKGEVKTIWTPIYFTLFFVSGLFLLTLFSWVDPIFSSLRNHH